MNEFWDNDNKKDMLYKNEISYRMVHSMLKIYWGSQYKTELYKLGMLIIKPEALIMGKVSEIISILQNAGYELIYYLQKKIDPIRVAELWKFSWAKSSLEHILINQKLFSIYDSIILILRLQNPTIKSTSEMLLDLKGPIQKSNRKPYQIRWRIQPINYVLNYVHTSDDSFDFLREIGILFDWNELLQLLESITSNHTIPYPSVAESILISQDFTLDNWINNICIRIDSSSIPFSEKRYIMNRINLLRTHTEQKITLNLLQTLCQYHLFEWNFETIVVLSNNINYLE